MKVSVFGAGALGAVYGVRLAVRGGVDVSFVVRPSRVHETTPIVIERVRGGSREEISAPVRGAAVAGDADVVLLAVGTEDLEALHGPLASSSAPIVVLTPMLPNDWTRVRSAFGERVYAALPSVVAYTRRPDGVVRYWTPPVPTRIDEPRGNSPDLEVIGELAAALSRSGLRARLELGVHETNPATTVSFIGIGMVIALAGSVGALLRDDALLELATSACRDGVRLAHRIGTPDPWARMAPAIAAPWALRTWLGALGRISPEALFYAEEHFGRKLLAQHVVMIDEMIALARQKGLPHASFAEIGARLRQLEPRPR